ncbi:MAG: hypothetical protein QM755_00720 [Luteolibacter sp.]
MDNTALEAAIRTERRWFSRTLGSSLVALLAYGIGRGIGAWGNKQMAEANNALANGHPEVLEKLNVTMKPLFTAYKISLVVLMLAGLVFLVSLVFWLLAMQGRKKLANPNSLV